ncbi:hypothetical protein BIV57_13285 [Mangrovactinospora gilvigrisea]|uniref:Uncharacterized protein n=1 Tax=Mangrovactinospora gilvigrisea TaxID=1428644 RepID=A0A1J7BU38_9ACTN|nr:hypothetical protein [Mangrovactinospora gilvigrisea]OIV36961.1 hypothetical protein BIV57_13285 [Mangrovactinospora gilvigrisea]
MFTPNATERMAARGVSALPWLRPTAIDPKTQWRAEALGNPPNWQLAIAHPLSTTPFVLDHEAVLDGLEAIALRDPATSPWGPELTCIIQECVVGRCTLEELPAAAAAAIVLAALYGPEGAFLAHAESVQGSAAEQDEDAPDIAPPSAGPDACHLGASSQGVAVR